MMLAWAPAEPRGRMPPLFFARSAGVQNELLQGPAPARRRSSNA